MDKTMFNTIVQEMTAIRVVLAGIQNAVSAQEHTCCLDRPLPSATPPSITPDMLAPAPPGLTRDQVLKWCVENRPSFDNNVPDMLLPQGWYWVKRFDSEDKLIAGENHTDNITPVDVINYVDPVDIVDEVMSREQAIEWCVENLIDFESLAPGMKPPAGWGFEINPRTDTWHMVRDYGSTIPIGQNEIRHHIDKQVESDYAMTRQQVLGWCVDNLVKLDTNAPQSETPPKGWFYQSVDNAPGEHCHRLALITDRFTYIDSRDVQNYVDLLTELAPCV